MYDIVIVGGGAAGLSAALVLGRARRTVLVIDDGQPRNAVADLSHGYQTRDGTPPAEILRIARSELTAYPSIQVKADSVVKAAKRKAHFSVVVRSGAEYLARRLLVATGVFDRLPKIDGLPERWGKSVFVCPFCDGWELRDQRVAVYGENRDAVELAQEIHGWTTDLVVCVGRNDLTASDRRWIAASGSILKIGKLRALSGSIAAPLVLSFARSDAVTCRALFISEPLRQHSPLFKSLGCKVGTDGLILVNKQSRTSVEGCYAAGDAVTKRHQVVISAASGSSAAIAITCDLLTEESMALAKGRSGASAAKPRVTRRRPTAKK